MFQHRDATRLEVGRQRFHAHAGTRLHEIQHASPGRVGQGRENEVHLSAVHR